VIGARVRRLRTGQCAAGARHSNSRQATSLVPNADATAVAAGRSRCKPIRTRTGWRAGVIGPAMKGVDRLCGEGESHISLQDAGRTRMKPRNSWGFTRPRVTSAMLGAGHRTCEAKTRRISMLRKQPFERKAPRRHGHRCADAGAACGRRESVQCALPWLQARARALVSRPIWSRA